MSRGGQLPAPRDAGRSGAYDTTTTNTRGRVKNSVILEVGGTSTCTQWVMILHMHVCCLIQFTCNCCMFSGMVCVGKICCGVVHYECCSPNN